MSIKLIVLMAALVFLVGLAYSLFRPLPNIPPPAAFTCLEIKDGVFIPTDSLPQPQNIYGMGLTYRQHLVETAAEYDPGALPPIFKKKQHTVTGNGSKVKFPAAEDLIAAAGELEAEVAEKLSADFKNLSPLLDYEVELGFVLLEAISEKDLLDESFVPQLGFFIANDLSARSVGLLGEGTDIRYEYWRVSKSFPGFLPLSEKIWIPDSPTSNSIPCIRIETYVNGKVRQSQTTDNMIFTPLEMLRFIHQKYSDTPLRKGDMVLTGTPGGVAISTPKALVRLSNLLGFGRYKKLSAKLGGDQSSFLKVGDVVEVRGEGFDGVSVEIVF